MRIVGFMLVLLAVFVPLFALADGQVAENPIEVVPRAVTVPEGTPLMYWDNGQLRPLPETALRARTQFRVDVRFLAGQEVVGEGSLFVHPGNPSILVAATSTQQDASGLSGWSPSYIVAVRDTTPLIPGSDSSIGHPWLDYWYAPCQLRLNDLRFDIYHPGADTVELTAWRTITPAPQILDQQGNIVFDLDQPAEGPAEFYGRLVAPVTNREFELRKYTLVIRQYAGEQLIGDSELTGLTNSFDTSFSISTVPSGILPEGWTPFIFGQHGAVDEFGGNRLPDLVGHGDDGVPATNVKVGFLSIYYYLPDAERVEFELYAADDEQPGEGDYGPLVDSVTARSSATREIGLAEVAAGVEQALGGDYVMLMQDGQHRLLPTYRLDPFVQYPCRFKFYSGAEQIGEVEIWAIQGLPAVIPLDLTSAIPGAASLSGENDGLIVINTPPAPHPLLSMGDDPGAVEDWSGLTRVCLHDLEFYVSCPRADRVEISAERLVRPAAVIDKAQDNVILQMHYPPDLPPETYGEVCSALCPAGTTISE